MLLLGGRAPLLLQKIAHISEICEVAPQELNYQIQGQLNPAEYLRGIVLKALRKKIFNTSKSEFMKPPFFSFPTDIEDARNKANHAA